MTSPIGLPVFSNRHLLQLTQDRKGLFKACNGIECKCGGHVFIKFLPQKGKTEGVFKRGLHTHKVGHKKPYLVDRTNRESSRCYHAWFTVSASHKALTSKSNKTPHFR
ncbi:hypothetical protein H5410_002926 [Solanum commersonii]|uniref:Uncharacterized protein n=1 Tax=Solanum commersonii TaxID=4109 RepID=A0A9J6B3C8_SOLCO|nr:hypothetical protein H5410_002926 [Solanum commersonii]